MKILYFMHLRTNPETWTRLGDMKMAYEMCRQLGDIHEIDVIGDFSNMTKEAQETLKSDMHAHQLLDMSAYTQNARYIAKMFENLVETKRLQTYDVVHIHTSKMNIVSAAMKYCSQTQPIVVSFHSPPESREMAHFYRDDMIEFCKSPHHSFICNSQTHRERCIKVLQVQEEEVPSLTYVYNGVTDIYEATSLPHEERSYAGGAISRINSIKSAYQTLLFMHKLSERTQKKCFFIGNIAEYERGPAAQEYYQQCLPLLEDKDKIEWIKSMSPEEIAAKFLDTDVNIYFGRVETFGLPILEAGLVGIPSLVLDENGPSEIVEDGKNGYKHLVTKPIKWKVLYEECLKSYEECLKLDPQSIREYTLSRFPVSNLGESINDIYKKVKGNL